MKSLAAVLLVFVVTFTAPSKIFGQDYIPVFSQDYGSRLSVEIDPIAFLYKGYSFHLRYQPMFSEKFLVGLGAYALNLPETMVDFNSSNRDLGWDVRIRSAFFLYGELYAKGANDGWFIGEQVGFQSFKVSIERESGGSTSFNNLLLMTYLGYSWRPYKGSFYIKPWIGLGFAEKVDGINRVRGSIEYDISPLFPYFTFHAGYTF
ncbi:MAG: hypothetical protein WEB30_06190 [Cyclobacteriaceae bacterium]